MTSPAPTPEALFEAARSGGAQAVGDLLDLDADVLRRLIQDLGIDRARRTRRWTDRERLREFIADWAVKLVQRNRVFLTG